MRDDTTSSTVIGSRYSASGFSEACSRTATAISANCSGVVPYSCMWRCAAMAYAPMSTLPYGTSYCIAPGTRAAPRKWPLLPSMRPWRDSRSEP